MNKLGTVEIPDRIKAGVKHYERLEGVRKAAKLVEEATQAYLKVITMVLDKDQAIQSELAQEKSPVRRERPVKIVTEVASATEAHTAKKAAIAT